MSKIKSNVIGSFEAGINILNVSDKGNNVYTIYRVKPGKYRAIVIEAEYTTFGKRNALLAVVHESVKDDEITSLAQEKTNFQVKIETKNCCIYDPSKISSLKDYKNNLITEVDACVDYACVQCFPGLGNGEYACYTAKNENGEVISITVDLIGGDYEACDKLGIQCGALKWQEIKSIQEAIANHNYELSNFSYMYYDDIHEILAECKAVFNELKKEIFIYCTNQGMLLASEEISNQPMESIRIYHQDYLSNSPLCKGWQPLIRDVMEKTLPLFCELNVHISITSQFFPYNAFEEFKGKMRQVLYADGSKFIATTDKIGILLTIK